MRRSVGEMFLLGFRGPVVPEWMRDFSRDFGLGGVILFDYDCIDRKYGRNIFDPVQLAALCADIHALPSRPLVFVDQEGGKVRRLKEECGFAPLPSARAFARLTDAERKAILVPAFRQMREIGIDVDLAPVVDLEVDPDSPDIGSAQRSYSADPKVVRDCARTLAEVAASVKLKLCLKHFPGAGGAKVNPHDHVMDLSECLTGEQVGVFEELLPLVPMVLVSHGIVNQWERGRPACLSPVAIGKIRRVAPEAIVLTDDLQMQGLQKIEPTGKACLDAARAGADFLLIGNNLMDEQAQAAAFARDLLSACESDEGLRAHADASIARIRKSKAA